MSVWRRPGGRRACSSVLEVHVTEPHVLVGSAVGSVTVTQVLLLCYRVAHPLGDDMFNKVALAFVAASLNLAENRFDLLMISDDVGSSVCR
jgi:hypothetical protein